ncbi:MAG: hypothetical protein WCV67_05800 [Victivallaceae bacterium]|jgi:hypothetical protein
MNKQHKKVYIFSALLFTFAVCGILAFLFINIFLVQPFSDKELLNYYFDLPYSDFKDAYTYYDSGCEAASVFFKFKMNGDDAQKRMQRYIGKCFRAIGKNEFEREYFKGPVGLKWWDPKLERKNSFCFISHHMKGKAMDEGMLWIDKDSSTIYVRFFYVYSDLKETHERSGN